MKKRTYLTVIPVLVCLLTGCGVGDLAGPSDADVAEAVAYHTLSKVTSARNPDGFFNIQARGEMGEPVYHKLIVLETTPDPVVPGDYIVLVHYVVPDIRRAETYFHYHVHHVNDNYTGEKDNIP